MDGIQTAETLRGESEAQIIFVTAFSDTESIQRASVVNPAGYLVKPFNELTLAATIQLAMANRDRLEAAGSQAPKLLRAGDVEIDLVRHRVFRQGAEVLLTSKEFKILACLAKQPDVPVSTEALLIEAWGAQYIHYVQALRVHVGNLRRKVESNSFPGITIAGLRGVGYRLRENERSVAAAATNQPSDLVFVQG
jgi:DNA-binding response OmpR family regulator